MFTCAFFQLKKSSIMQTSLIYVLSFLNVFKNFLDTSSLFCSQESSLFLFLINIILCNGHFERIPFYTFPDDANKAVLFPIFSGTYIVNPFYKTSRFI